MPTSYPSLYYGYFDDFHYHMNHLHHKSYRHLNIYSDQIGLMNYWNHFYHWIQHVYRIYFCFLILIFVSFGPVFRHSFVICGFLLCSDACRDVIVMAVQHISPFLFVHIFLFLFVYSAFLFFEGFFRVIFGGLICMMIDILQNHLLF